MLGKLSGIGSTRESVIYGVQLLIKVSPMQGDLSGLVQGRGGEDAAQLANTRQTKGFEFIDFLVKSGRLNANSAARASHAMTATAQCADTVLLELGLLPDTELAAAQAQFLGARLVELEEFPESPIGRELAPISFLRRSGLIPLSLDAETIVVAAARPLDSAPAEALGYYLDRRVDVRVARRVDWEQAFSRIYEDADEKTAAQITEGQGTLHEEDVERLKDIAREAPVIRFVNGLINDAVRRHASDIHIEPLGDKTQIRLRIDGMLVATQSIDKSMTAGITSRLKIMSKLNIAERRLPQDGRIALAVGGREIDLRISTVPTLHGESVVMRVLDRKERPLDLPSLGFDQEASTRLVSAINRPNGVVLVSGPTGSGKTTTLYACLCELRRDQRKILTIEDPVEYQLDNVIQTQVRPTIGWDFAAGLRAFLRQDPDIIMVGEIRDQETAKTAVQASLTGHLVLSTVHTNSAAATISRLLDMGVEDYLLVSTLRAIVAQRLVRRLCTKCRIAKTESSELLNRLGYSEIRIDIPLFEAKGCQACGGQGYRGRTTIHEIMTVTDRIQSLILGGAPDRELENAARGEGMQTLLETGIRKAIAGETSLEEVLRVASAS
jgi:general secretion pathway protein E